MKQKLIEIAKGIGTICLYFLITSLCGLFLGDFYFHSNILVATISQLGMYFILLLILSLIYFKRLKNDLKNFKKEYFSIAFKNWLIGLAAMVIVNIIITQFVGNIAANEESNRMLLNNYPISSIISMIFLGPLIEEITFRLSFQKAFNKWWTFALTTAVIFGFVHTIAGISQNGFSFQEIIFILPYGTLGFFFAKSLYETNNVFTSYLTHFFQNTMSVVMILLLNL